MMSQPKLKQFAKLLKEWEVIFGYDHTKSYSDPDESQPPYADMIHSILHHVESEVEEK